MLSLNIAMQGMVDRSVLLSSIAEAKMQKDELQVKAKEVTWFESRSLKAEEQVEKLKKETEQLRAEMTSMVSRSDLDTAKSYFEDVEATARGEIQKQLNVILALNNRLSGLEEEKNTLIAQMQVLFYVLFLDK
jgi:hypothetical protein